MPIGQTTLAQTLSSISQANFFQGLPTVLNDPVLKASLFSALLSGAIEGNTETDLLTTTSTLGNAVLGSSIFDQTDNSIATFFSNGFVLNEIPPDTSPTAGISILNNINTLETASVETKLIVGGVVSPFFDVFQNSETFSILDAFDVLDNPLDEHPQFPEVSPNVRDDEDISIIDVLV